MPLPRTVLLLALACFARPAFAQQTEPLVLPRLTGPIQLDGPSYEPA